LTPSDFFDCLREYCTYFPDFNRWACENVRHDTKSAWAGTFEACEKTDLMAAIQKMRRGEIPSVAAYERERTPIVLLLASQDIRRERERRRSSRALAGQVRQDRSEHAMAEGILRCSGCVSADRLGLCGLRGVGVG
jgi:hypothetical protein